MKESTLDIMQSLSDMIRNSKGLELEIIATAFINLKDNPKLSIQEVLLDSFNEWVK